MFSSDDLIFNFICRKYTFVKAPFSFLFDFQFFQFPFDQFFLAFDWLDFDWLADLVLVVEVVKKNLKI